MMMMMETGKLEVILLMEIKSFGEDSEDDVQLHIIC